MTVTVKNSLQVSYKTYHMIQQLYLLDIYPKELKT